MTAVLRADFPWVCIWASERGVVIVAAGWSVVPVSSADSVLRSGLAAGFEVPGGCANCCCCCWFVDHPGQPFPGVGGVGPAGRTGEGDAVVGVMFGVPQAKGFEVMVKLAEAREIAGTGDPTVLFAGTEFIGMVQLASPSRLPAARESAGLISLVDVVPLGLARPVGGSAEVERGAARRVDRDGGDGGGAGRQCAGQIRRDRAVAVEFTREVVQSGEGGRGDGDVQPGRPALVGAKAPDRWRSC